jgi:hypothetical protein
MLNIPFCAFLSGVHYADAPPNRTNNLYYLAHSKASIITPSSTEFADSTILACTSYSISQPVPLPSGYIKRFTQYVPVVCNDARRSPMGPNVSVDNLLPSSRFDFGFMRASPKLPEKKRAPAIKFP